MNKSAVGPVSVAVFFLSAIFYLCLFLIVQTKTDIMGHLTMIMAIADGALTPPANFVYYLSVYLLALGNTDLLPLAAASTVVLSLSIMLKFLVTRKIAEKYLDEFSVQPMLLTLLCVLLLLAFSFPTASMYIGQFPANVWHNSTTICLMPFALALYFLSYLQLKLPIAKRIYWITGLCVVNLLIKPSFFLAFSVAYPLMFTFRHGVTIRTLSNLIPVATGGIVLVAMYYAIYTLGYVSEDDSTVVIAPFRVWSILSSNIPLSLLASFAFPVVYLIFNWRDLKDSVLVQYSVLLCCVSVVIFVLLAETGPRSLHANFLWQCVVCNYMLFLVLSLRLTRRIQVSGAGNIANLLPMQIFFLHVLAGISYLVYFGTTGDFL